MLQLRRSLGVLLVLCMVVAAWPLLVTAQESELRVGFRPDAPPYAIRGPHPVGTVEFSVTLDGRPLLGTLWYPAHNPGGDPEQVQYDLDIADLLPAEMTFISGHAIRDTAADSTDGPYPLVVWSTVYGGTRYLEYYLLEHLASRGFVVSTINHPGSALRDTLLSLSGDAALADAYFENGALGLAWRPAEIRHQIDLALNHPMLQGMIDPDRVVVAGRNFGAIAALLAAGAQLDIDNMEEVCAGVATSVECRAVASHLDALVEEVGMDVMPDHAWPSMHDPRIKAVVVVSPAMWGLLPMETADVTVPLLLFQGTNDLYVTADRQRAVVYDAVASEHKVLVSLEGAADWATSICPEIWLTDEWYGLCSDPVWDSLRVYDLLDHFVVAFLRATLDDDSAAIAALAPEAATFPGVHYETTMMPRQTSSLAPIPNRR